MQDNRKTFVFIIDDERVEIKDVSLYSAKKRAKRIAGAGVDCEYIGEKKEH